MKATSFKPTNEQSAAIEAFSDGRTLVLNACAGSGKTATLEAMANESSQKGLYIVFSKAAANEARTKFPRRVAVKTSHSLAFGQIKNKGYSLEKMLGSLSGKAIAEVLQLKELVFDNFVLLDFEVGHAVRLTISAFCHSDSNSITHEHVPKFDFLKLTCSDKALQYYLVKITESAKALWSHMCDRDADGYPLGHDGYFKLWSLSLPQLPFSYALLDEAQDSNPALLHVLKNQTRCQLVLVGDRYQQIYAWRGAVNSMERFKAEQHSLTRSFRYGQHIADFATALINLLGNEKRLIGRSDIVGRFSCEKPDAYICRTNAVLIETLVELRADIQSIYIVGEGKDILALLDDVERLQNKKKAAKGEFFGFKDWQDVLAYCQRISKNPLATVVQLVEKFGAANLRLLVSETCKDSQLARITLSTAHKAKGLEFDEVCLGDDFTDPVEEADFIDTHPAADMEEAVVILHEGRKLLILKSELQVLYVAVTRARKHVSLPRWCYEIFGDIVGEQPVGSAVSESSITMHQSISGKSKPLATSTGLYAVLDFETTGLNPGRGDRAIELGISLCSEAKVIDTFSSLINPGIPIDEYITSLTGISNEMVADAPSAKSVMRDALDFVGDAQLVAHNASFDKKFWRHEIKHELSIEDDREFLCTLMLSRRIFQSFASHKLCEIAQELGIDAVNSHRALADAQVTSQVLFTLFERLNAAYPDERIDGQFLKTYQKRSKASLPDLTTEQLARAAKPHALTAASVRNTSGTTPTASENALRAEQMNADAQKAMQLLDHILEQTLTVDDRLDWVSLIEIEPFRPSIPRRPYIIYDDDGIPVDIEYLSSSAAKPAKPVIPSRPKLRDYAPKIGITDKLMFRSNRLQQEAVDAYQAAIKDWHTDCEQRIADYNLAVRLWSDAAKSINHKNDQRYRQCIDDQKRTHAEKLEFDQRVHIAGEEIEAFKLAYFSQEPKAVERYCREVLSRSTYPDYFPEEFAITYHSGVRTLSVRIRLIHPDDLPTVASVSYVKSRDEFKVKDLSATARNTLYANVVRTIAVRTLHELVESDTADAIENIVVSGYVDTVDLATGHDQESVIISVHSTKAFFLGIRLDRVDAASCFEGLGGRGTPRSIARLKSVKPIDVRDLVESSM